MITFRISTDVPADRRVVIHLPQEIPAGKVDLLVSCVVPSIDSRPMRTSLAAWAEENAESLGAEVSSAQVETFSGRRF